MEEKPRIIIKKVKKRGHGDAHGGSWKVAYADFVTALMAFFLLLWLLAMVSPDKRAALSTYFSNFSIMTSDSQKAGSAAMDGSSGVLDIERVIPPTIQGTADKTADNFEKKLRDSIDQQLQTVKDQVFVDKTKEGIRIQIVDNEGSEIFRLGSDEPTQKAREIIKLVSENMKDKTNRIVIEGHTDSAPFKTAQKHIN